MRSHRSQKSVCFHLLGLAGLVLLVRSAPALASPMIEVGGKDLPRFVEEPEFPLSVQAPAEVHATLRWLDRELPRVPIFLLGSGWIHEADRPESAEGEAEEAPVAREEVHYSVSLDFLEELIRFVDGFAGMDEKRAVADFRAQFLREISEEKWPGWAWALVAYRSTPERLDIRAERTGGGFGIQIPLAGAPSLTLDPDQWHLVLRVLPIAGNYERFSYLNSEGDWEGTSRFPLQVRPTVEAEWSRKGIFGLDSLQPGMRFLVQGHIPSIMDVRAVGEVFIRYRVNRERGYFESVDLVPRCMYEINEDSHGFGAAPMSVRFREIAHGLTCYMHVSVKFEG